LRMRPRWNLLKRWTTQPEVRPRKAGKLKRFAGFIIKGGVVKPRRKVLFLDIDGVLHGSTVGELIYTEAGPRIEGFGVCEHERLLAQLLEGHDVAVVVHSTWVRFGQAFLEQYLPNVASLGRLHLTRKHIESRALRIEDIVRRWKLTPGDYRILDDSVLEFGRYPGLRAQLIACPREQGLGSPAVQRELTAFLQAPLT
jgi:hypothetical protein